MRTPTVKDVAREAGVSTATVSRVLSGKEGVSEDKRLRVLAAIERLGYRPNAVARSLRVESTRTLGLVISNVTNPFFTEVARAVEDEAAREGYSLILGNADEDPAKEELYLNVLLQKQVDGILLSPARSDAPHLLKVVEGKVPVVFLDRSIDGAAGAPVVRADGRGAVDSLVEHLIELGHRRLAIISGPREIISGRERLEAFLNAAGRRNIRIPDEYIKFGNFRRSSGFEAMRKLLALAEPPTAVFAANNLMALGALQALEEAGVRIPQEISFASFDDVPWFGLLKPPITAIAQPTRALGASAASLLIEMIRECRSTKGPEPMEAQLVIRGSCGPVREGVR